MKNILLILIFIFLFLIYVIYNNYEYKMDGGKLNATDIKKINIIVPVRNRKEELKEFIFNIDKIMKSNKVNYRIYIVEQSYNNSSFNRGKLINIGISQSLKHEFSNIYYITDVDIYPKTYNTFVMKYITGTIKHLYGNIDTLGGVFIIDKNTYSKINGYSNNYWSWGLEDNDLFERAKNLNITLDRTNFSKRYSNNNIIDKPSPKEYQIIKKNMYKINKIKFLKNKKLYENDYNSIKNDGLNNINYNIIKINIYDNKPYILNYLVDI